jgi:hypothetical protein
VAPDEQQWWDEMDVEILDAEASAPVQGATSRRGVVSLLGDALDLAVEDGGLDWNKRRAIEDILISPLFANAFERLPQIEAEQLLESWENEAARLGSIQASKRSDIYATLTSLNQDAVIKASLTRLEKGASPHVLALLGELAGAAPAATETTVAGASHAWLDWGRRQGFLQPH